MVSTSIRRIRGGGNQTGPWQALLALLCLWERAEGAFFCVRDSMDRAGITYTRRGIWTAWRRGARPHSIVSQQLTRKRVGFLSSPSRNLGNYTPRWA